MPKLKTLAVPASIFLLLMAAAQPASATNWVELGKNSKEETWSIDRDSVQTKGSIVSVWVKKEYPDYQGTALWTATSMVFPIADYSLLLFEFDFSDRTYRQVAMYDYGANGERTGRSNTIPSRWEHIAPDTIAEYVYSILKKWLNR